MGWRGLWIAILPFVGSCSLSSHGRPPDDSLDGAVVDAGVATRDGGEDGEDAGTDAGISSPVCDRTAGPELAVCPRPLDWSACHVEVGPVDVARGYAAFPDVAWTGRGLVVAAQARVPGAGPAGGTSLFLVDALGTVLGRTDLTDTVQAPRLEWHPTFGIGMLLTIGGAYWIDAAGCVVGARVPLELPHSDRSDVASTPSGFLLLSGTQGWSPGDDTRLLTARVGAVPGRIAWESVSSEGPRHPPEHATGADGFVTSFASAIWDGAADVLTVTGDRVALGTRVIGAPTGQIAGMASLGDVTFFVRGETGPTGGGQLSMIRVTSGGTSARQLDGSEWAHVESLGSTLVLARASSTTGAVIALTAYDAAGDQVGEPLAMRALGYDVRIARTGRGLAVVWAANLPAEVGTQLAIVDCCPP